MKLNLFKVSSTDTNAVKAKFQFTGDNMSSEEISVFLQKQIAEDKEIELKVKGNMYIFILSPIISYSEVGGFISRIKNILDELITEDERRKIMPRDQVERSLRLWLADKESKGEIEIEW